MPTGTNGRRGKSAALPTISATGVGALGLVGAPWWVVLAALAICALGCAAQVLVDAVFPQDSSDRLTWWQSFWNRARPSPSVTATEHTAQPTD